MSSKSSLKDFEILNKLGQGSFGSVFKVLRKIDKKIYVMKMIDISQMDYQSQQKAVNEVKILASLENPYIVKYFDSFIESKTLHIVMEYCEKGDLSQAIRSQMGRLLAEARIWKYFIQMCLALEYVHSKKILHRDIKSMNVFLIKDDVVRVGDLGVAKVLSNTATFAHTMVGTPYYLSPELCEEKPYNVKSDVWALGCILYELCTLKRPFEATNQAALILKILTASYLPINAGFSTELKTVLDGCLCKDYRKRVSVTAILSRNGMKERALSLGITIPASSVWAGAGVVKEPALGYVSQMGVIEEEKEINKKVKSNLPVKSFNKRLAENNLKIGKTGNEKNEVREKDDKKEAKNRIFESPKIEKIERKSKEAENKAKEPENKAKDIKKTSLKQLENKQEIVNFNNIEFNPPPKPEPKFEAKKPACIKPSSVRAKIEPKNSLGKLVPKISSQKELKPESKPPNLIPRPAESGLQKLEPVSARIPKEEPLVQPRGLKSQKSSPLNILSPKVLKVEHKEYSPIQKPIIEELPYIFENFSETTNCNFTKTGFRDFIPVINTNSTDFTIFKVNHVQSKNRESPTEDDDELYCSVSEEDFQEGEETVEEEDLQMRIKSKQKAFSEAVRLENERKQEIIKRVGLKKFREMYDFFKSVMTK